VTPAQRKLIVVSNRGPVSFGRDAHGARVARRGGGGLVTALRSLVSSHEVTWIASAMTDGDHEVVAEARGNAVEERARDGSPYRLRLIAHDEAAYDWYYNVIANPTLWFLQHYLWSLSRVPDFDHGLHHAWSSGYVTVNESFADAVVTELDAEPDAIVFFHDYHLYLAPRLVRERRPDATLAHFVHTPWAQSDYWHVLPAAMRAAVHDGMLANDVIGFHTDRWRRNFVHAAEQIVGAVPDPEARVVGYEGRSILVGANPISVDPEEFEELAGSDAVRAREREILARHDGRIVLRVDRTDPSKNVVRGFSAFEVFLDAHPELHGEVTMLALLDPSRQDIPEYSEYLGAIQRAAREVNDRFQGDGWMPIDLQIDDDFPQSVAAYKQFDVLLVNAIFDGMNLVAKEAPLVNERAGVLVLSENTGAHDELGEWALSVNPFDVAGQADAIYAALMLPEEERRRRQDAIRSHVQEHDLLHWIGAQLHDLEQAATHAR